MSQNILWKPCHKEFRQSSEKWEAVPTNKVLCELHFKTANVHKMECLAKTFFL